MYHRRQSQAGTSPAILKPPKPEKIFTGDDIFRFVVWALQAGHDIHFDFRKLKGGPYGYSLPATIVWGYDRQGRMVHGKIMWAGYPSIAFGFPAKKTKAMVYDYLEKPFFERIQYTDARSFKVMVAMKSQISL